ncbi:hypothetical protein BT69DRAFT_1286968 [Atractiella rhizophila]|nr:hypothetical protein BT69DRAFT_1286968 [Atractiella rhizophila]
MACSERTPMIHFYKHQVKHVENAYVYVAWTPSFLEGTGIQRFFVHLMPDNANMVIRCDNRVHLLSTPLVNRSLHIYLIRSERNNGSTSVVDSKQPTLFVSCSDTYSELASRTYQVDLNDASLLEDGKLVTLHFTRGIKLPTYPVRLTWGSPVLHLSLLPPNSPIGNLPLELLDYIFVKLTLASSMQWSGAWEVSRLWQQRLQRVTPEPLKAEQKMRRFASSSSSTVLSWKNLQLTREEQENGISMELFCRLCVRFQPRITKLNLEFLPATGTAALSWIINSLTRLETIEYLTLDGWAQPFFHRFLDQTSSWHSLKYVRLVAVAQETKSISHLDFLNLAQRYHPRDTPYTVSVLLLQHIYVTPLISSALKGSQLRRISAQDCFMTCFDFNQRSSSLENLQLSFHPLNFGWFPEFESSHFRLEEPLNLSRLPKLYQLTIDGGDENTNVLPSDIFKRKELFDLGLRKLGLHFCRMEFDGALDFIQHSLSRGCRLYISLFYAEWTERQLALAQELIRSVPHTLASIVEFEDTDAHF